MLFSHSKALLFLPGTYSQQLFAALSELQLIFTLSDTVAALKCRCSSPHLSSPFSVFVIDPIHCSLGYVAAELKETNWMSPLRRPLLSRCSSWCSSGFRNFSVISKPSALVYSSVLPTFLLFCGKKQKFLEGIVPCHVNWQCRQ